MGTKMIGEIYYSEDRSGNRRYFQEIIHDRSCPAVSYIRVFSRLYGPHEPVSVSDLINDTIMFYAMTWVDDGCAMNTWKKSGMRFNIDIHDYSSVVFFASEAKNIFDRKEHGINRYVNWKLWHICGIPEIVTRIPESLCGRLEIGNVKSCGEIYFRIFHGYYRGNHIEYMINKRIALPEADSFVLKLYVAEKRFRYIHFIGNEALREVVIDCNEVTKLIRLSNEIVNGYHLYNNSFGNENWHEYEFVSREEFECAWDNGCVLGFDKINTIKILVGTLWDNFNYDSR